MGEIKNPHMVLEELDQQWRHAYAEKLAAWEKFRWTPFDETLLADYQVWSKKVLKRTDKIVAFKCRHHC
ncbi:MAG: hypothetical protein OER85_15885 [Gammaproteobacteria bacterium]|nr:hypothetical protein [Gammaproteobacteria bacterium]